MASSSTLILVNKVLTLSGDAPQQLTVVNSVGDIARRIVEFINLTISDIEAMVNWSFLRSDSAGVADGVDNFYTFAGVEDIRTGGGVSVWITGKGTLQELSPAQFDAERSQPAPSTTAPTYFVREADSLTQKLRVRIFPTPMAGDVINVSGYKRATRLDPANDLLTTEFDDAVLVYGALMHLDAYDGLQRGYGKLYRQHLGGVIQAEAMNREYRVIPEAYK